MLKLYNNKAKLYQWDLNQKLVVDNEAVKEIHFSNATTSGALVCEVYALDGLRVADIPNILLQSAFDIKAFGFCGECVRTSASFEVVARAKPQDYTYTETEIKRYEDLEARIAELEASGGGGGGIPQMIAKTGDNFSNPTKTRVIIEPKTGYCSGQLQMTVESYDEYGTGEWFEDYTTTFYNTYDNPDLDLKYAYDLEEWDKLQICENIGAITTEDLVDVYEEIVRVEKNLSSLTEDVSNLDGRLTTLDDSFDAHILEYTHDYDYFSGEINGLKEEMGNVEEVLNTIKAHQETYINGGAN